MTKSTTATIGVDQLTAHLRGIVPTWRADLGDPLRVEPDILKELLGDAG